jgi:hypothetical protein
MPNMRAFLRRYIQNMKLLNIHMPVNNRIQSDFVFIVFLTRWSGAIWRS